MSCGPKLVSAKLAEKHLEAKVDPEQTIAIAVLHSRKFTISLMIKQEAFSSLQEVYTFNFKRNAFNFVIGDFGPNKTAVVVV